MTADPDSPLRQLMGSGESLASYDVYCLKFRVRKIETASMLWLNKRWLLEKFIDPLDLETLAAVENFFLSRFAVEAVDESDPKTTSESSDQFLWADMYGSSGGTHHGGSGRVGSIDGFNAKGIGRTPLASPKVDFHHAHGYMWLHEALREIVAAEVAAAELPHGAIPIIALIDTGLDFEDIHAGEYRRRVIAVRPDFIRPAHFERSIFFGTSGTEDSDQFRDAQRVSQMVQCIADDDQSGSGQDSLVRMFEKFGEQIGAARALRLWAGQFQSSNLSVCGAYVDFGAFCAMPDWRQAERQLGERFGDESQRFESVVRSVFFYFWKYDGTGHNLWRVALRSLEHSIEKSFADYVVKGLGCQRMSDAEKEEITGIILHYYNFQQRQKVKYESKSALNMSWIHSYMFSKSTKVESNTSEYLEHYVSDTILNTFNSQKHMESHLRNIELFFKPRPLMYPDRVDTICKIKFGAPDKIYKHNSKHVSRYIDRNIYKSRRYFPEIENTKSVCKYFRIEETDFYITRGIIDEEYRFYVISSESQFNAFSELNEYLRRQPGIIVKMNGPFVILDIPEKMVSFIDYSSIKIGSKAIGFGENSVWSRLLRQLGLGVIAKRREVLS